jgi:hypothetical protein
MRGTRTEEEVENYATNLVKKKGIQQSRCHSPLHLRTETGPVSDTLCFLVSRIPDDGKSPKSPVSLGIIHHRQNPLESN